MKGKSDPPILLLRSTPLLPRSRRPRFKTLLITCLVMYLFYTNAPARLRSWRHPILTPDEKWMLRIADLMTELYNLLEKMRYLKPNSIAYPPHSSSAATNATLTTTTLKLSPVAIKFLQILPYVKKTLGPMYGFRNEPIMSATNWRAWRYNNELLLSTAFADMRDPGVLIRSRDPWYSDMIYKEDIDAMLEEGDGVLTNPRMTILKPWQMALTGIDRINVHHANDSTPRGGTMILDLKTRNLFTVGAGAVVAREHDDFRGSIEDRGSIDPETRGRLAPGASESMNIDTRAKIEMYASRPATEALRDYIERFRSLEWVPGFLEHDRMVAYPRDAYRELYIAHGWPNKFDGKAFERARIAWDQENRGKWRAAEPIRQLRESEKRHQDNLDAIQSWKDDLETLHSLDPDVRTDLYDPRRKAYNGRTRDETIEVIQYRSKIVAEDERKLPGMRRAAENVSDEVRRWRDLYKEKYGSDYELEFVWETVRYE